MTSHEDGKGREVLQHQATQEAATPNSEQCADIDHLDPDSTTDVLRHQWASIVACMDSCPQAFAAFVADVLAHVAKDEHWTCGSDALRRFIGSKDYTDARGRTFRVRHGHDAVYLRELCRRHPDIAPHIAPRLHRSRYDAFYSDEYIDALKEANAHPEKLMEA